MICAPLHVRSRARTRLDRSGIHGLLDTAAAAVTSLDSDNGSNNCSFQTEWRSTEIALFEPPQLHQPSATYRDIETGNEGLVDQTGIEPVTS